MRSLLDYAVKLAAEAERDGVDFKKIEKLKGASLQYKDKTTLKMDDTADTLLVKDELITMISSIRDRIVHDGHLDISAKVYENFKRRRLNERFVLIPDMIDGRFEVYKNRKNFYGRDQKINLDLPNIVDIFYARMITTIETIQRTYIARKLR